MEQLTNILTMSPRQSLSKQMKLAYQIYELLALILLLIIPVKCNSLVFKTDLTNVLKSSMLAL